LPEELTWTQMNNKKLVKKPTHVKEKALIAVASAGLALGLGLILYQRLKARYAFFQECNIGPDDVSDQLLELFAVEDREKETMFRIRRAKNFLKNGETDVCGFLVFSTLETHLRDMVEASGSKKIQDTGNGHLLKCLRSRKEITEKEFDDLKFLIQHARNPVFHGQSPFDPKVIPVATAYVAKFIAKHKAE
jgi:hypothetical protein